MTDGDGPRRVSVTELPLKVISRIEHEVGLPVGRWGDASSLADVLIAVYAGATGKTPDEVGNMSYQELTELVDLVGDEGPTDPT